MWNGGTLTFSLQSPSIIQRLGLRTWNREINLGDKEGALATIFLSNGRAWQDDSHDFLYIRQDIILSYLKMTRQKLVWRNWGEHSWRKNNFEKTIRSNPVRMKIIEDRLNIYRNFEVWNYSK